MKKAFVFLFAVCLIALLVPSVQAADSGSCGEGVAWALVDGTLTISGNGAMADYTSASDAPWYSQRTSVVSIVIEDGVTAIGAYAFWDCAELTSVIFEGTAPTLGSYSFNDGSVSLVVFCYEGAEGYDIAPWTSYSISRMHVGEWIVDTEPTCSTDGSRHIDCAYCQMTITENVPGGHRYVAGVCTVCAEVQILKSGACGVYASWKLDALGTLTIYGSGSMRDYDDYANVPWDSNKSSIKTVIIESGIMSIGKNAFSMCSNLENVDIPESVLSIGVDAFSGCRALASIAVPKNVSAIGARAFSNCSSLTNISIPDGVVRIYQYTFRGCNNLTTINIPSSIVGINGHAFEDCNSLTTVWYQGTKAKKSSMAVDTYNDELTKATWHYEIVDDVMDGQKVYYCAECHLYFHLDGSVVFTLAGSGFTLSFEDEILVNFYYTVSAVTDLTEQGMLVFYTNPGEVDIVKADAVYGSEYVASSDSYIATTDGIAAKEMGDDWYYCAYAKLSDGGYAYSPLYQYSPKKYAMNMLGKDTTSDKQKALCVAMLNYGAAAQEYFGYKTDDLMNANLTEEQKALVLPYDAGLFEGAVAADPGKVGMYAATDGFSGRAASVSFEGAFSINFYFAPNAVMDSNLVFYYWTAEDYADAERLAPANASGKLIMELRDGVYAASVEGIAPKDLDKTYYVAGAYLSDMQIHCTGVIAYSLSKYCMNNATGNMGALAQATAMYGYYANQYFA